jgi:hypothetical protein
VKGVKVTSKGQSFVELKWAVPPAYNDDIIAFRIGYRVNKDVLDGGRDDSPFALEMGVSRRSHSPMYIVIGHPTDHSSYSDICSPMLTCTSSIFTHSSRLA